MHVGLILAGGQSRRLGRGDKALVRLGGVRLVDHVRRGLEPQVDRLAISTAAPESPIADLPAVADDIWAGRGPLAGILAGLRWCAANSAAPAALVTVPTDTPFLPADLVDRLAAAGAQSDAAVCVAASGGRLHHAVALWPIDLADHLEAWLGGGHGSAVRDYLATCRTVPVSFDGEADPFFNINTAADLDEAERRLAGDG